MFGRSSAPKLSLRATLLLAGGLAVLAAACFRDPDVAKLTCTKSLGCPVGYACSSQGKCCKSSDGVWCDVGTTYDAATLDGMTPDSQSSPTETGNGDKPTNITDGSLADGKDVAGDAESDTPLFPGPDTGPGDGRGTGGIAGTGGVLGMGGSTGSGGATGLGGADAGRDAPLATGGIQGMGGITSSGGVKGTGGFTGTGGNPGTGGSGTGGSGTGGAGTGGAIGTGGYSVVSGLPVPPGTDNLPQPSGTPGNLTVLNWAGFKAAVSFTFDDGNQSVIDAYPQLQALNDSNNVRYTFYLITSFTNASNQVWVTAKGNGHEIGNHSNTHVSSASDIDTATTFITSRFGERPWTFAAPNGTVDLATVSARFLVSRGVVGGQIAPNDATDPFNLPSFLPASSASSSALQAPITTAQSLGKWQIFLVHGFTGDSNAYQPINLSNFLDTVTYAKSLQNVWIDGVVNVAAYWRAQKLITSTTPTVSGNETRWAWTLPANFPPGRYIRVKVDGGTLTQGSNVLPWNGHGYYEVALDKGSLTLSP